MLSEAELSNSQCTSYIPHKVGSSAEEEQKYRFKCKTFLGFFYIFLSSVTSVLCGAIIQHVTYINAAQLSSIRSGCVFLGCLPIAMFCVKDSLWPKGHRFLLLLRGVFIGSGYYFQAMAFRYLPLVEMSIITATTPAFMTLAARFYLKESCGVTQTLALLLTASGMFLSIRLPELIQNRQATDIGHSQYIAGICFAMLFVLFFTGGTVILGKFRHMHFTVPLMYSSFISCFESGTINFFVSSYVPPLCGLDQWLIILMGALFFITNATYVLATQLETIAVIVIIKQSWDIILSAVFQTFTFYLAPNLYNLYGAVLVLLSTFTLSARKIVASMPEGSRNKKRFKFLLI